jgi:hypothetical protein
MRNILRSRLPKKGRSDNLKLCDLIANAIHTIMIMSRSCDTIGLTLVRALLAVWRTRKRTARMLVSQKQAPLGVDDGRRKERRGRFARRCIYATNVWHFVAVLTKAHYWYHLSVRASCIWYLEDVVEAVSVQIGIILEQCGSLVFNHGDHSVLCVL